MPLLKKRSFEKASSPEFLRDDEEVFYCEITNEIFRNYEEFAERMLLCTSMVWTCAMTGKSNLTYEEALESEENAKKSIKEFPIELRIPILYVGSKTKKTGFGEMAEDVFLYCKDRYFIGEKLETSFTGNKWVDSTVLQVIAPNVDNIKTLPKNGNTEKHSNPPASLYKYEIEHFNADDRDISEIMIVDYNQIRRRKTVFSREKCKLFLKQYVEQDSKGHWVIKPWAMKEYGIDNMKFEKIFSGQPPNFDPSRRFEKKSDPKKPAVPNGKKSRQETLAKYLTKPNGAVKTNGTESTGKKNSDLLERMEKRKEEFEKKRVQMKEQRLAQKLEQKKANVEMLSKLKDWNKPKEDLELEDQQPLPNFPIVKSKLPVKYLGDMLMLMEFVKSFDKILKSKNFLQSELTYEIMERALIEKEVAGPLIDLIHMFLTAIFRQQEEENKEYSMQLAKSNFPHKKNGESLTFHDIAQLATLAGGWSKERQGLSLRNLPLYSLTLTEVLRLHLISSGAKLQETGEKGRFMQRGGYCNTDDPGLYLTFKKPHIVKALAVKNVVQLRMKDKMAVLICLMNQLLTYADIRDVIEDKIEKNRLVKLEVKNAENSEKKRNAEYNTAVLQLKRESKTKKQDPKMTSQALEDLKETEKKRKLQHERDMERVMKSAYDKESFLGMDRAFRKYFKLESIPGVFIDLSEDYPGACLAEPIKNVPELANAEKSVIMDYLKKATNKRNSSDKENSPVKKSPKKMNGHSTSEDIKESSELLMCSADKNCIVHRREPKWCFIPQVEMMETLMSALNNRGIRERELLQALKADKETLVKLIKQTPIQQLNMELDIQEDEAVARSRVTTRGKKNYADANFGFPAGTAIEEILRSTLTDDILEMEEKIYSGSLGQLTVKSRDAWRNALLEKDYDNFSREIVRRTYAENETKMEVDDEEEEIVPETKKNSKLSDPGTYLENFKTSHDSDSEEEIEDCKQSKDMQTAVECLAIALAQVAQAVEPKFLQKPLGDSTSRTLATYVPIRNRLSNWEKSLLTATSFSQVFLHYGNLDSCIMWSRSTLLAKCRICRRQKDSENMLLCDKCNLGHHLYCLKPKLTSIPKGDWFCDRCTVAEQSKKGGTEVMPKKKRRLFKEEEQEEEEEPQEVKQESEEEEEESESGEEEKEEESEQEEEEDEEESIDVKVDLCNTCNSGGVLITCDECQTSYHKECVDPPLRKVKSNWVCRNCRGVGQEVNEKDGENGDNNNVRTRSRRRTGDHLNINGRDDSSDSDNYPLVHHAGGVLHNERRSAAKARHNIYNFIKSLRRLSSSDDDSDSEVFNNSSSRKRSLRRESGRDDLPLHNAALQDLLADIMKHPDAWPFLRPVQKNEVPDYYDVITHPMDFGTIKYKLNMGEYNTDAQLMYDVALVFDNCNTYNEVDSEIYRCGERLLQSFRSKCSQLGLKIPSKHEEDQDENKRRRKK